MTHPLHWRLLHVLVLCLMFVAVPPVLGQSPSADVRIGAWEEAQVASQRRHLWRIGAWGAANAVGGLALWATAKSDQRFQRGFGMQSSVWGVINLGIGVAGLLGSQGVNPLTFEAVVQAERNYHDIVLLNMGLNVGYMAVGTAMVIAASQGVRHASSWRGHGTAVILQGAGLFVLDGITLFASRTRLGEMLSGAQPALSLGIDPAGSPWGYLGLVF